MTPPKTFTRRFAALAGAAALMLGALSPAAMAQSNGDALTPGRLSGTITLTARSAAIGVGFTTGQGTLRYGGRSYPFTVEGINIAAVGFARITAHGPGVTRTRLQDFSGTYAASTGQATVGRGVVGQILQNGNGVQIRLDGSTRGADLQGSVDGMRLTLK